MPRVRKPISLPVEFRPDFWQFADGRCTIVKVIKQRLDELKRDAQADSTQKVLLCQRVVFLSLQLETLEREATEKRKFDAGLYVSLVNSLTGLLRLLGIEKKAKTVGLQDYIQAKERA
jgi:hypothetical protein